MALPSCWGPLPPCGGEIERGVRARTYRHQDTASRSRAPEAPGFDLSKSILMAWTMRGWRALDEHQSVTLWGAQPSARRGGFCSGPAWARRRQGGSIRTTDLWTTTAPMPVSRIALAVADPRLPLALPFRGNGARRRTSLRWRASEPTPLRLRGGNGGHRTPLPSQDASGDAPHSSEDANQYGGG